MRSQIFTKVLTPDELRTEFEFCIRYLQELGHSRASVLFGWSWGNEYYPTGEWQSEKIELEKLSTKVQEVEDSGIGRFGDNDLFVEVEGLLFTFCHESDVHMEYEVGSEITEILLKRWSKLGYSPTEYLKPA